MEKLTEEGQDYMEQIYGNKNIKEAKRDWIGSGISMELLIASFNYASECDEANPDQDFIEGVKWERKRKKRIRGIRNR